LGGLHSQVTHDGVSMSLTASWTSTTFHMGEQDVDNSDVVCTSMSVRPDWLYPPAKKSPDCGYVYHNVGIYTVQATTIWDVAWVVDGYSGTVTTSRDESADEPLVIGSLRAVNVEPPK
jgi:hypothetical protein